VVFLFGALFEDLNHFLQENGSLSRSQSRERLLRGGVSRAMQFFRNRSVRSKKCIAQSIFSPQNTTQQGGVFIWRSVRRFEPFSARKWFVEPDYHF
jgi:hypothetical protein